MNTNYSARLIYQDSEGLVSCDPLLADGGDPLPLTHTGEYVSCHFTETTGTPLIITCIRSMPFRHLIMSRYHHAIVDPFSGTVICKVQLTDLFTPTFFLESFTAGLTLFYKKPGKVCSIKAGGAESLFSTGYFPDRISYLLFQSVNNWCMVDNAYFCVNFRGVFKFDTEMGSLVKISETPNYNVRRGDAIQPISAIVVYDDAERPKIPCVDLIDPRVGRIVEVLQTTNRVHEVRVNPFNPYQMVLITSIGSVKIYDVREFSSGTPVEEIEVPDDEILADESRFRAMFGSRNCRQVGPCKFAFVNRMTKAILLNDGRELVSARESRKDAFAVSLSDDVTCGGSMMSETLSFLDDHYAQWWTIVRIGTDHVLVWPCFIIDLKK